MTWPRVEFAPRKGEEAVFSSSEDRIRAGKTTNAVGGHSIVSGRDSSSYPHPWVRRAAAGLFAVLFPSNCRTCGLPVLNISRLPVCPDCLAEIHPIRGAVCSICGVLSTFSYAECDPDGMLRCPVCRRVDRPFLRAVAYGSDDGGLRELIHLLKYNGVRPAANVLGRMLAEAFSKLQPEFGPDVVRIVPVPLYKGKRQLRGFNQAELIARHAVKDYGDDRLLLASDVLLRTRDTQSQIGLTSRQRRENMQGAFAVANAAGVIGRKILLVDDVYTTGTTATECARALRKAGAARVWVATVARTRKLASKYEGFNVLELPAVEEEAPAQLDEVERFETMKS